LRHRWGSRQRKCKNCDEGLSEASSLSRAGASKRAPTTTTTTNGSGSRDMHYGADAGGRRSGLTTSQTDDNKMSVRVESAVCTPACYVHACMCIGSIIILRCTDQKDGADEGHESAAQPGTRARAPVSSSPSYRTYTVAEVPTRPLPYKHGIHLLQNGGAPARRRRGPEREPTALAK
jgi:hypothetical protein